MTMTEQPQTYRNPVPTVDIIIEMSEDKIILIERKNLPSGWAIPGGFVDYGETLEAAAIREAKEETSLDVELIGQFHTYSDPKRDNRLHTISTVFIAKGYGIPLAADDAQNIALYSEDSLPEPIAFDHGTILKEYFHYKKTGSLPK